MSNVLNVVPLLITDKDGVILYKNEAAHELCAAVNIGDSVKCFLTREEYALLQNSVAKSDASFSAKTELPDCKYAIFDLSRNKTESIWRIYPVIDTRADKAPLSISYSDVANELMMRYDPVTAADARRFTLIYDTLLSLDYVFDAYRRMNYYDTLPLIRRFVECILPRLRNYNRELFYMKHDSVGENSIIYVEPFSFFMILCAVCCACGYVTSGGVNLLAEEHDKHIVITVSSDIRQGLSIKNTASFGFHSCDIVYADIISKHCGYGFSYSVIRRHTLPEIEFTIKFPTHAHNTVEVKTSPESDYIIDIAFGYAAGFLDSAEE